MFGAEFSENCLYLVYQVPLSYATVVTSVLKGGIVSPRIHPGAQVVTRKKQQFQSCRLGGFLCMFGLFYLLFGFRLPLCFSDEPYTLNLD